MTDTMKANSILSVEELSESDSYFPFATVR